MLTLIFVVVAKSNESAIWQKNYKVINYASFRVAMNILVNVKSA